VTANSGLRILSIDHGPHDLVPVALTHGADPARIPLFKALAVQACVLAAGGRKDFGMFLDGALGAQALTEATAQDLWVAQQFPQGAPGPNDPAGWPASQVVKLIANNHADARTRLADHLQGIADVMKACRVSGRRTLIEALPAEGESTASLVRQLHGQGLMPDYWLVEAQQNRQAWQTLSDAATHNGVPCQGLIVIARTAQSHREITDAAGMPGVIGFVGGRSIFASVFSDWLTGKQTDDAAVMSLAERFSGFAEAFDAGKPA
jgi:5-dehydro-2-deoxygluconokinase